MGTCCSSSPASEGDEIAEADPSPRRVDSPIDPDEWLGNLEPSATAGNHAITSIGLAQFEASNASAAGSGGVVTSAARTQLPNRFRELSSRSVHSSSRSVTFTEPARGQGGSSGRHSDQLAKLSRDEEVDQCEV